MHCIVHACTSVQPLPSQKSRISSTFFFLLRNSPPAQSVCEWFPFTFYPFPPVLGSLPIRLLQQIQWKTRSLSVCTMCRNVELHDLRERSGVNGILGMCVIANQTSNVRGVPTTDSKLLSGLTTPRGWVILRKERSRLPFPPRIGFFCHHRLAVKRKSICHTLILDSVEECFLYCPITLPALSMFFLATERFSTWWCKKVYK